MAAKKEIGNQIAKVNDGRSFEWKRRKKSTRFFFSIIFFHLHLFDIINISHGRTVLKYIEAHK